jgi:hypothetical protein
MAAMVVMDGLAWLDLDRPGEAQPNPHLLDALVLYNLKNSQLSMKAAILASRLWRTK